MKDKKELWRSLKFVLFSASAGIIQSLSIVLCNEVIGLHNTVSYLIGLVLSVLWNFTLNRRYTFQSANNVPVAMLKVALFYAVFTPGSLWLVHWLTESQGWHNYLADGCNMLLNLVLEFLYDRFYVFRDSIDSNDLAKKQK